MNCQQQHSICVFENGNYSGLYGKVDVYLSDGYSVVYAVEAAPVADTIVHQMNSAGIEADDYIKKGSLTILDRNFAYSPAKTKLESRLLLESWRMLLSEVARKGAFKGLVVMGMPQPFFETMNHQKLVEYEQLASREFDGSFEAICCYTQESIASLPLKFLIPLLNSHQSNVMSLTGYGEWRPVRVLELIIKGLEKTVGKANSRLVFQAMRHTYRISEGMVISHPGVFENVLRAMFADSASIILDAIKDEIIKDVSFTSRQSESLF